MTLTILAMIFVLISSIEAPAAESNGTPQKQEMAYKYHGDLIIRNSLSLTMLNPKWLDIAFESKTGKHKQKKEKVLKKDYDYGIDWHYDYPFSFQLKAEPTNLDGPFKIGIKIPSYTKFIWLAEDIEFTPDKTDINRDFTINNRIEQLKEGP